MRIEWESGDVDPTEAVRPSSARGGGTYRATLRAGERWTALRSQKKSLRIAGEVGAANFMFTAPVAHYPGRGLDLDLDLIYNSRVWQLARKAGISKMVFDIDRDQPAPGWSLHLGRIVSLGPGAAMVVERDGSRRPYRVDGVSRGPSTVTMQAHTTDGTHITYWVEWENAYMVSAWMVRADGTRVDFGYSTGRTVHATLITDRNGNCIAAEYDPGGEGHLTRVTDTCGRVIDIDYREDAFGNMVFAKVRGPAPEQNWNVTPQPTVDLVVVNVGSCALTTTFAHQVHEQPARSFTISGLYYPATKSGFWFPASSYCTYGMLRRVQACRGMSLTPGTTTSGPMIEPGPVTWQREYNYPDAGPAQSDVPTYTTLTETYEGVSEPALTRFSVQRTPKVLRTDITWPDNTHSVRDTSLGDGNEPAGLLKQLSVWSSSPAPDQELQRTTVHEWSITSDGTPQMTDVHVTSAGKVVRTSFAYGPTSTKPTLVDQWECTFIASPNPNRPVLRRTQTEYVTEQRYLDRNLRDLPKTVRVYADFSPYGTIPEPSALTEYEYDEEILGSAFGAPGRDERFDPQSTNYVPGTMWRGNPTTIRQYADAEQREEPVIETRLYDNCGNLLVSDIGPGRVEHEYYPGSRFIAPEVTWLAGTAATPSVKMALTRTLAFTWGGQPLEVSDPNGHVFKQQYDQAGRIIWVGSTITNAGRRLDYDDAALTVTDMTYEYGPNGPIVAASETRSLDGRGLVQEVRKQRADGAVTVGYAYDDFRRLRATTAPHRDGEAPHWRSAVDYDALGRPVSTGNIGEHSYQWRYDEHLAPTNRTPWEDARPTVRIIDQNGGERWMSFDGLRRLKDVVAPDPAGSGTVMPTGSTCISYEYDGQDNIIGIDLRRPGAPSQHRRFRYDSLGRLVRHFLPECGGGLTETIGGVREYWSAAFSYDSRSNLISSMDGRGILIEYNYGNDPLDRLEHITYTTKQFHDTDNPIVECPSVDYAYETTGDLRRLHEETCNGVSNQLFFHDPINGLTSTTVFMASAPHRPFTVNHGTHDSLLRPRSTNLPAMYEPGGGARSPVMYLQYGLGGLSAELSYDGDPLIHSITYTAADQVASMLIGTDGIAESYAHTDRNPSLVTGQAIRRASVELVNVTYEYNKPTLASQTIAQMRQTTDVLGVDGSRGAFYDQFGRLDNFVIQPPGLVDGWGEDYEYDLAGNRTKVVAETVSVGPPPLPDGEPALTYDSDNRITTAGFSYDAVGNLVKARVGGVDYQYQYDAAGRLAYARNTATGEITGYVYGACNRRRATIQLGPQATSWPPSSPPPSVPSAELERVVFHAWDGDRVVATYDATGPDVEKTLAWKELFLFFGTRLVCTWENEAGTRRVRYHHPGPIGTRYVTDAPPGGSLDTAILHEVLPFGGAAINDAGITRVFSSYERDSRTGLDYAVNRFYHPALGRFLQPDPAGARAFNFMDAQSLNGYSYCRNDPLNWIDPLGLETCVQGVCYDDQGVITSVDGQVLTSDEFVVTAGNDPLEPGLGSDADAGPREDRRSEREGAGGPAAAMGRWMRPGHINIPRATNPEYFIQLDRFVQQTLRTLKPDANHLKKLLDAINGAAKAGPSYLRAAEQIAEPALNHIAEAGENIGKVIGFYSTRLAPVVPIFLDPRLFEGDPRFKDST